MWPQGAKELRDLLLTMILSFPALINVGSVLLLVVFMFGVLGVNLFTYVAPQDNITEQVRLPRPSMTFHDLLPRPSMTRH